MSANGENIKRSVAGKSMVLVMALVIGLMTAGCAFLWFGAGAVTGAAVGVGVTAYVDGKLQTRMKADPRAIEKASVKAFEAMNIRKVSSAGSASEAEIIGRTTEDTKVAISVKAEDNGESSVYIRVGTFGDQAFSLKVYDEINKHLPDAKSELEKELKNTKP
ncbi:MAG: DUF3568 family protein [Victivallaceae bacterium]|jgi:hypothetical protein